jgi:DNA-binding MarR family transcriptional regulator
LRICHDGGVKNLDGDQDTATSAVRLAVAVNRFRARLREEAGLTSTGLSSSQIGLLHRLFDEGPVTAASLAAVEHVTQQAIAQSLIGLRDAGFVEGKPDPTDGRKVLVNVTESGRRLLESIFTSRDTWLTRAIDSTVAASERADLNRAIDLLERLAGADLRVRINEKREVAR